MTRAVVIGGGLVGLSTAALLAHGGLETRLLERHPDLGGRSAPIRAKGAILDASPWPFLYEAASGFFALLGRDLHDYLDLLEPDIRLRVFMEDGASLSSDTLDLEHDATVNWGKLDDLAPDEGQTASRLVLRALEREPVVRQRLLGAPLQRKFSVVNPSIMRNLPWSLGVLRRSIRMDLASSLKHPGIRSLLEYAILGLTGSPSSTPVAYSGLYCHLLTGTVRHPRGGVAAVVSSLDRVAREEGVEIATSCDVARILVDPDTRLATGVVTRSGDIVPTDLVVSCVDPHHVESSLLPAEYRSYSASVWTRPLSPSAVVATVIVKKRVPQLAHHNVFLPKNWDRVLSCLEGKPLLDPLAFELAYIGRPTATDSKAVPRGKDRLSLVVPLPADPTLGADAQSLQDLHRLIARVMAQVGLMADIPDLGDRFDIEHVVGPANFSSDYSAPMGTLAGISPSLKTLLLPRPTITASGVRNLVYSGMSILPGWGMEGAFDASEVTARALLDLGTIDPLPRPSGRGFLRSSTRPGVIGDLLREIPEADAGNEP
jgi:phytoene desaturase